jgi:hypothetical protein
MSVVINNNLNLPEAPYRGAEPFRYVDHPIFFARREETRKLQRLLIIYRGVLLYGDSGAGKSSLVNGGLIPAALEEGFIPDRIRLQAKRGQEIVVERISERDDDQAPYLPSNLTGESAGRSVFSLGEFKKKLEIWRGKPRDAALESRRPLLIFDQFEEFITRFEEVPRQDELADALDIQDSILRTLVELLWDDALAVKLLFVFREDYLAKLNKLFVLCPPLKDQYLRLTPPETKVLPIIIRGPFQDEKMREHFARSGKEISEALARELIAQMTARNKGDFVNLSEVQLVCRELWSSENPKQRLEERQVEGLLEDHLNRSLEELDRQGLRDPAVALLGGMVTPSGRRNVISEYTLCKLVSDTEHIPEKELKRALAALVDKSKVVRRELRAEEYYYLIVSEFLAPWITRQTKERQARQIESKRREFEGQNRRLRRGSLIVVSVILALLLASLAFAYQTVRMRTRERLVQEALEKLQQIEEQKNAADREISELFRQKEAAVGEKDYALALKEQAERERDIALQQHESVTKLIQLKARGGQNRRHTMFGSTMLEVAIGLILIYLLLSLICAVLQEIIGVVLSLRAKYLRKGITTLLGSEDLTWKFYQHPLIKALCSGEKLPSYIPARAFALALMDIVAPAVISRPRNSHDIRAGIAAMPESDIKKSLLLLIDDSGNDLSQVRESIEEWFHSAMDRVAGSYKQRTQVTLLLLGFILAVVLNVNTLFIANRLSYDSALRESLVAQSQALVQLPPAGSEVSPADRIKENLKAIEGLGLPIGWSMGMSNLRTTSQYIVTLLGWLLTALVIPFGASLWFDVLNKFMVVRSTVKPREKSFSLTSMDKPAPEFEDVEEGDYSKG